MATQERNQTIRLRISKRGKVKKTKGWGQEGSVVGYELERQGKTIRFASSDFESAD